MNCISTCLAYAAASITMKALLSVLSVDKESFRLGLAILSIWHMPYASMLMRI